MAAQERAQQLRGIVKTVSDDRKLPGKTEWSGRRRPSTRRSGYQAKADVRLDAQDIATYQLSSGQQLQVDFTIRAAEGQRVGFGGWFTVSASADVMLLHGPERYTLSPHGIDQWSKLGSQWITSGATSKPVFVIEASEPSSVALYGLGSGRVNHSHYDEARPELLGNMWRFAPEANFYEENTGEAVVVTADLDPTSTVRLWKKSCNRCGRFLPINLPKERETLSFSNHCVADHRRPCSHAGFGRIRRLGSKPEHNLEYGFQLECRFCKKFEVNAPHNPQRTSSQMKEDAARRRAFELLLDSLYHGTPSLRYSQETGSELAADVYARFNGKCFKCGKVLGSERDMHLDHTRPLALLWPLDQHATALCAQHNSEKRDRLPVEYYNEEELGRLGPMVGLSYADLYSDSSNQNGIDLLHRRLDWFFEYFLFGEELQRVRDGKRAADLLLKALHKAILRYPGTPPFDILDEGRRRGLQI